MHECLQLLKTPTLGRFIARLRDADPALATATLLRVRDGSGEGSPNAWTFECNTMQPGMFTAFFQNAGIRLRISHLLSDPTSPENAMPGAALMIERADQVILLPEPDTVLKPGDRVLFVGRQTARRLQRRYLDEPSTVSWVLTGTEAPRGFVFRWWEQKRRGRNRAR